MMMQPGRSGKDPRHMTNTTSAHVLIDTHTHIVSPDTNRYPQRGQVLANGAWWSGVDCSFESLVAEVGQSDVDGVVLVQAAGPYGADNTYLTDTLGATDHQFLGVGVVDPAEGAVERLKALAAAGLAGVRLFAIPYSAPGWLAGPVGNELIDTSADLGITVGVCCQPEALDDLAIQLQRRPDVTMVLDHCGFADFRDGPPFSAAQPLWDLASHNNLVLKFTPTLVRLNDAQPDQLLQALVDHFGADRIVWGSDWPQHREVDEHGRQLSYVEQVDRIVSWMTELSPQQQQLIAGQNTLRLFPGMFTTPGAP